MRIKRYHFDFFLCHFQFNNFLFIFILILQHHMKRDVVFDLSSFFHYISILSWILSFFLQNLHLFAFFLVENIPFCPLLHKMSIFNRILSFFLDYLILFVKNVSFSSLCHNISIISWILWFILALLNFFLLVGFPFYSLIHNIQNFSWKVCFLFYKGLL